MGRAPCCEKVGLNRGPWTREEDMRLIQYIKAHGEGCWRTLPKAAGLLRCGKSCRLRWINYLRPDLKRGNISEEEDRLIIKLHSLLGNRWSLIAGRLPGRTDNEIKNYWNTHLKKKLRNMGIDPQTHQPLEKVQTAPATHSQQITPVTGSGNAYCIRYDVSAGAAHSAYPLQHRRLTPSPALNFKAKPLEMDPSQLEAFKRASFNSSFQIPVSSVEATLGDVDNYSRVATMNFHGPSSPASILSYSSSITEHTKDTSSPCPDVRMSKQPQNSSEAVWSPSIATTSKTCAASETCSSGSSMEGGELLTILSEIYPRTEALPSGAAATKVVDGKLIELESRGVDTREVGPPASVLSFLESDFMWDMEMMHPIEDVGTPTGVLPTTSSDLWGHDCAQTDAGSVPPWLNEQDRRGSVDDFSIGCDQETGQV